MVVSDIATVDEVKDGADVSATGTRVAAGDNPANAGARIVLASEGVQPTAGASLVAEGDPVAAAAKNATNLLYEKNYIQLPLYQLVKPDDATANLAGATSYDWLTVDRTGNGNALEALVTTAGGNVGVVTPTLKRITGLVWEDANNNGLQDKLENGQFERAQDGYQVTLERYYSVGGSGTWVKDTSAWGDLVNGARVDYRTTITGDVEMQQAAKDATEPLAVKALGEHNLLNDLWRHGTYEFDNLETSGVVGDQWVVYGYKVRVSDSRVTNGSVLKAKNRVATKANPAYDGTDPLVPATIDVSYTEDSDLFSDNALVDNGAPEELIVLLDQVDVNGQTADGRTSVASNMISAPASNNGAVEAVLTETGRTAMTKDGLAVYDLMSGYDRDHNDGGIVPVPTYQISGYLYEDADYDGLYNYLPETRTDTVTGKPVAYSETGYNNKSVYLQKWFYVPNNGTGWDSVIPAGATVSWVKADGTSATSLGVADKATAKGAWVMLDEANANTPALSFYGVDKDNAYTVDTAVAIDGRVETRTNTYKTITDTDRTVTVAKTNNDGQAVVDESGKLTYDTITTDVDGYFRFDKLPTAGFLTDGAGNRTWYLMGYTLEVDGSNAENGMFSLLVTSYEWQTTPSDAINSDVQPMLTDDQVYADDAHSTRDAEWLGYNSGNYPVYLDEATVQTGTGKHHTDWVETVVDADGSTQQITHEGSKANPNAALTTDGVNIYGNDAQITQRVQGGVARLNGVSKNALDGKLVLAGMADGSTNASQKVAGSRTQIEHYCSWLGGEHRKLRLRLRLWPEPRGHERRLRAARPHQPLRRGLVRQELHRHLRPGRGPEGLQGGPQSVLLRARLQRAGLPAVRGRGRQPVPLRAR